MNDLKSKTCLIYDHGMFVELAFRIAREGGFGTVLYSTPWEDGLCKIDRRVVGAGFEEFYRVKDPWGPINRGEVDVVVFPDVYHAEMQKAIAAAGIPVWGARDADWMELNKLRFRQFQRELGMETPDFEELLGLDALRSYLMDHEDCWVKTTPQFRGNRETFHHADWETSREIVDALAVEFGPMQDHIHFLVEQPIKANLEVGVDTYSIDGRLPANAVMGFEIKDKCYLAHLSPTADMPDELLAGHLPLMEEFANLQCRQMLSTEVRITEDGKPFLLEPTIRFPSPAGEAQMELYRNLPEIIWAGAHGELVEPEFKETYAVEAAIIHDGDENHWRTIEVDPEFRQWIKLYNAVGLGGDRIGIIPSCDAIGYVVGVGDTPKAALDHLKANVESLDGQPVTIHVEALVKAIQEAEESEKEGVPFSDEPMPKVEEVVT